MALSQSYLCKRQLPIKLLKINQKYMKFIINIMNCCAILCLTSCAQDKKEATATATTTLPIATPTKSTNNRVFGVARIEPENGISDLVAGTSGKILAVMMHENQIIEKGKPLLTIDQVVENSQLQQAKSKIAPQRATISTQRANVETLKTRLKNANEVLQRNQTLYQGNVTTQQTVDDSRYEVERLVKEVAAAEMQVAQANSRISEIETDIKYYETVLGQKKVLAPQKGKILKVLAKVGEYAKNDMKIAEFAPDGALVAKTEVDEIYADRIQLKQKAFLLSQTSGDTLATGSVYFAADYLKAKSLFKDQSTEQEDRRIREVHIKIESGKKPLIGSRVDCIILL
jgi:HlyD family secretion protein